VMGCSMKASIARDPVCAIAHDGLESHPLCPASASQWWGIPPAAVAADLPGYVGLCQFTAKGALW
jgi:hypothetical protein